MAKEKSNVIDFLEHFNKGNVEFVHATTANLNDFINESIANYMQFASDIHALNMKSLDQMIDIVSGKNDAK